jgi:flagellar M-ring protein FliF
MKQGLEQVRGKWRAIEPGTRLLMIVGLLGLAVAGYVVYQRSTKVDWAVLYANVDDTTASKVLAGLDAHHVPYEVQGNGTRILVPRAQLGTTRVTLAGEGITAQPVPQGFAEIFAKQGLASSDFEQRVSYQRALEGELARTLLSMEPVAGARVQLSIPEQSLFVADPSQTTQVPTASVMLSLKRDLTRGEADTIANIVASSVPGLSADQVTIASSSGAMLRAPGSSQSSSGTEANVQFTSDFEQSLATRLTSLTRTMTGSTDATTEVRALFDFTQSTTENEKIDPSTNVVNGEHTVTIDATGTGVQAAGSVGADGGPLGSSGNGTLKKTDETKTYTPGDRTITKSTSTTPKLSDLHVAVVVPVVPPKSGALTDTAKKDLEKKVKDMIVTAAGIDTKQADNVNVAIVDAVATDNGSLITSGSAGTATGTGTAATTTGTKMPVDLLAAAAGGGAFFVLFMSFMAGRGRRKRRKLEAELGLVPAAGQKAKKGKKGAVPQATPELAPRVSAPSRPTDPDRQAVDEIKADLERMVAESPESLAALLSGWMAK